MLLLETQLDMMRTTWMGTAMLFAAALLVGCASNPLGKKVKEPFQGNKYESNARFFRAVGKGQSRDENIAKKKASHEAKAELGSQMNTTIKEVTDDYLSSTEYENKAEITAKFQSLSRAVTNADIADLRKIGEEKYYNEENYTVFIAYEIKKAAMFRFLKKQAKTDKKIKESELKILNEMLDAKIEALEVE